MGVYSNYHMHKKLQEQKLSQKHYLDAYGKKLNFIHSIIHSCKDLPKEIIL
jgi:hypothetical protein